MAKVAFEAELRPSGRGGGGHLLEVPSDAIARLGGKGRIPVRATFDGVPYRGSIVRMGDAMVLGVTKAIIAEADVRVGDMLSVVVENDDAPREVDVPPELAEALRRNPKARAAFDALSYSHRREYATAVADAKRPETRARRVASTLRALLERASAADR